MALVAVLAASAAGAATSSTTPVPGKRFTGTGRDYENDGTAKAWKRGSSDKFSFTTSKDGTRAVSFRGGYSYYCPNGSAFVTAKYVNITATDRLDYRFAFRETYGMAYVEIKGAFQPGGRTADLFYLVDFVPKGTRVRHPYDTSHPGALGCASWVKGTAKAS